MEQGCWQVGRGAWAILKFCLIVMHRLLSLTTNTLAGPHPAVDGNTLDTGLAQELEPRREPRRGRVPKHAVRIHLHHRCKLVN